MTEMYLNSLKTAPDAQGKFGIHGGRFVAETLMPLILDVENAYEKAIKDQSFLVRGAAIWALQQLDNKNNLKSIKKRHLSFEKNNVVLAEWNN